MKAGEAYFSPNMERVIFQAIPVPAPGTEPDKHYSMYVANFSHDAEGVITGLNNIRRLSEPGSSNTCGWFHPIEHNKVLFASTIVPPVFNGKAGYQKDGSRYAWAFPEEMDIVTATMASDGSARASPCSLCASRIYRGGKLVEGRQAHPLCADERGTQRTDRQARP